MEIYTMVSSGSFVYKKAHFPDFCLGKRYIMSTETDNTGKELQ